MTYEDERPPLRFIIIKSRRVGMAAYHKAVDEFRAKVTEAAIKEPGEVVRPKNEPWYRQFDKKGKRR